MSVSVSAISSVQSTLTAVMQEASETRAVTMQEAARGDQQAIRKLAREQATQVPESAPQSSSGPGVDALA